MVGDVGNAISVEFRDWRPPAAISEGASDSSDEPELVVERLGLNMGLNVGARAKLAGADCGGARCEEAGSDPPSA